MKLTTYAILLFAICITQQSLKGQSYSSLDPRIQNHYTELEYTTILSQDPDSVPKIIFYYTQSFRLINNSCSNCIIANINDIDITKYDHLRLQSTRMLLGYNRNRDMIELLSRDELNQQYLLIENNH